MFNQVWQSEQKIPTVLNTMLIAIEFRETVTFI